MSKISTIFLLFIAFALTITSCEKPQKYFEFDEDARDSMLTHIIPLKDAIDSYKDYGKSRNNILKDTLRKKYKDDKFEDTRMVWFDIETIKQYLIYVEEESKKAGVDPKGIQFYFSVNSEKASGKKKNHQSFFIAPTIARDSVQSGYTLDSNGKVILLKDKLKDVYELSPNQRTEKAGFFAIMLEDKGLLLNDGNDTPPGGND